MLIHAMFACAILSDSSDCHATQAKRTVRTLRRLSEAAIYRGARREVQQLLQLAQQLESLLEEWDLEDA
jgi:hypothetical protein